EAGGARIVIRGGGAIGVVEPREAAQLRVAKRLHSDAQAIHAGAAIGGEPRRVNRLGVRFERHLAIARDVERLLARADDAPHLAWLEERRRAAAEVDRVGARGDWGLGIGDWLKVRNRAVTMRANLAHDRIYIPALQIRVEEPAVEVAVVADRGAERNVDVKTRH